MSQITTTRGGISERQRLEYHQRGYLVLRDVLDAGEVSELGKELDRLFADPWLTDEKSLRAHGRETTSGGRVVDRLDPVIDVSPLIRRLAHVANQPVAKAPSFFRERKSTAPLLPAPPAQRQPAPAADMSPG